MIMKQKLLLSVALVLAACGLHAGYTDVDDILWRWSGGDNEATITSHTGLPSSLIVQIPSVFHMFYGDYTVTAIGDQVFDVYNGIGGTEDINIRQVIIPATVQSLGRALSGGART